MSSQAGTYGPTALMTSGGSGVEGAARALQGAYPQAQWKPGKLLGGADAAAWARGAVNA